jgi:hypothetical protein
MPVVAVQPDGQFGGAFFRGGVRPGVGPFAQAGLDEALGLAVIRYENHRRLVVRLFPEGNRRYGEPIRDTGRREHEGAGRPCPSSLHGRPLRRSRMRRERGSVDVVSPASSRFERDGGAGMRVIGLDIHRAFAEAVGLGRRLRQRCNARRRCRAAKGRDRRVFLREMLSI